MRKRLINEMFALNRNIEEQVVKNQSTLDWSKGLLFFDTDTSVPDTILRVAKLYSETDNLARLTWDNKFHIIDVNDKFLKRLGYKRSDLIGEKIIEDDGTSKFIVGKHLPESIRVVTENTKKGVTMMEGTKNEWYAKDGSIVAVNWFVGFNDHETGLGSTQCEFEFNNNQ